MASQSKEILVYCEIPAHLRELVGKARQVANSIAGLVSVLAIGNIGDQQSGVSTLSGVDVIYTVADSRLQQFNPDAFTDVLSSVIKQRQPLVTLVGATKQGMEIAPRAAERSGLGYSAWVVDFNIDPADFHTTTKCMIYSGIGTVVYRMRTPAAILSAASGVFEPADLSEQTAQIVPIEAVFGETSLQILGHQPRSVGTSRWEEAKAIVDVGQGVKQKEDLELVNQLTSLLVGQMACSRPMASDRDWFPEWLGLSGKKVTPELCMTVGISGAIQHIVGIRDSRLIVSINSDEGAPIFNQADYGVVADLYEFVPALIKRLKDRGVRPVWS